jgi:hypothetical protein
MLERHDTLFLDFKLEQVSSASSGEDFPSRGSRAGIQRVSGTGIFRGKKPEVGNEKRNFN